MSRSRQREVEEVGGLTREEKLPRMPYQLWLEREELGRRLRWELGTSYVGRRWSMVSRALFFFRSPVPTCISRTRRFPKRAKPERRLPISRDGFTNPYSRARMSRFYLTTDVYIFNTTLTQLPVFHPRF